MRPIVSEQNFLRNPLNNLLGTEAHVRLLRVLAREVDGPLSASDAAERAGLTGRGAQKALRRLVQTGFVLLAGGGRKPQYELRKTDKIVNAVIKLFHVEAGRYEELIGAIREKIGTTEPPPLSAWIEDLPTEAAGSMVLGIMHESLSLSGYVHELTKTLREVEQDFDVTVEVKGYTKADAPELKQGEIIHLYGVFPFTHSLLGGLKNVPRTHEEMDRHLLELARILSSYIEKDTSIVKRAKEHVKRLLEREQGTATRDIEEWYSVLKTYSLRRLSQFLTSASERANRLRQSCPLFAVLTVEEQARLFQKTKWQKITGKVIKGYGVASGQAKDSPYPQGSIVMQTPFFLERGLDIKHYYPATLNVSIAPKRFKVVDPEWTFRDVAWFEGCCETFSFSRCRVIYNGIGVDGFIYYPHPETKPDHFQDDSVLEILAPFLGEVGEGERVSVLLKRDEVDIV